MKLLRVISTMNPSHGGPCQGIRNLAPYLIKLGIDQTVVCLDSPTSPWITTEAFPMVGLGKGAKGWGYHSKLIPWLKEHIQEYDAVICHGPLAVLFLGCPFCMRRLQAPLFRLSTRDA